MIDMSDKQRVLIQITDEQRRKLDEMRIKSDKPIPSLAELIRRAIDYFLKANN